MSSLDSVAAISPGTSIPALLQIVAERQAIHVDKSLSKVWIAVLDFLCHLDDRIDGDYEGGRQGGSDTVERILTLMQPLIRGLLSSESMASEQGFLNARQEKSWEHLEEVFRKMNVDQMARSKYSESLLLWISASYEAKAATSGRSYCQARFQEGVHIGDMFTAVLPHEIASGQRDRFSKSARELMGAGQLFDSLVDLSRDRRRDEIAVRQKGLRVLILAGVIVHFVSLLGRCPSLARPLLRKLPRYIRNRSGALNSARRSW